MKTNLLATFKTYILTRICKTLARCWLVTTSYGQTYGFTTHTRNIVFEGVTYLTLGGFRASDIRQNETLSTDTLSVQTFLSNVDEQLIAAGLFDHSYVEMFTVNYLDLSMGKLILKSGYLGEISRSTGIADFELRGLTQQLDVKVGRIFSLTCDADLGDDVCGVNVYPVEFTYEVNIVGDPTNTITRLDTEGSFIDDGYVVGGIVTIAGSLLGNNVTATITLVAENVITLDTALTTESGIEISILQTSQFFVEGSVTGILTQRKSFVIDSSPTTDFFTFGTIEFTSGANLGFIRDINKQTNNVITTMLPFPYDIQAGDTFEMIAGCSKDYNVCIQKFNNGANFPGFPFIPVKENVFSSPIASPDTVE